MKSLKQLHKEYTAEGGTLPWKLFKEVLVLFNTGVSDMIVKEGYRFKVPGLGTLRIIRRKKRSTMAVNFKETNRKKQEILDRGGTPYEVLERDKDGKIIKDNGGEKYLVLFSSPYYFCWSIGVEGLVRRNGHTYKFKPTRGVKGNWKKLIDFMSSNPLAELMYVR